MSHLKPYPKYKPSGVEWLGDVPEHWEVKPIKRTFQIVGGSTPKSGDPSFWDGDIVWVTPADLSKLESKWISDAGRKITLKGLASCGSHLVPAGAIILSTRAPIGSMAIASKPLCTNQGCKSLVPNRNANTNYFAYYLSVCVEQLNVRGKGTTFLELSGDELGAFESIVPQHDEQSAIADFLDRETGRIDALVEKKQRFIELLKEKRQALITAAVTGQIDVRTGKPYPAYKPSGVEWLGDVPEHWEVKRLKYAVRCLDGRRIPLNSEQRADIKGDIPYWGSGGVVDYINQYLFDEELILLGEDGAPFFDRFRPVAYFVSGKVWINNHIHVLRNISRTPSAWIVHALNCVEYRLYIDGSTRDKLTQDDMKEIALPFPSNAQEAKIILEILDRETGRIDALVEKTEKSIELLREKRAVLIAAAVTGKIDVRGNI